MYVTMIRPECTMHYTLSNWKTDAITDAEVMDVKRFFGNMLGRSPTTLEIKIKNTGCTGDEGAVTVLVCDYNTDAKDVLASVRVFSDGLIIPV